MNTYHIPTFFLLLGTLLSVACASPPRALNDWEFLGDRTVNHRLDRDEIRVTVREGTFRRIKLKVLRSEVAFLDVKVHYANGGVEDVSLRRNIPAGGETRAIDLNGQNRIIEKVVFHYTSTQRRRRPAVVQLFGLR